MKISFIMITLFFTFFHVNPCSALTESEYLHMLQTSDVFRKENTLLTDQWLSMKNTIKGDAWKKILDSQREWLHTGRDEEAKKNMTNGYAKDYAYAKAIHDRIAVLCAEEDNYKLTPEERAKGEKAEPENYYDLAVVPYGEYDGKTMGRITKIIPTSGDLSQIYILDAFGQPHIYYISRHDIAEKTKKYQSGMDPISCANPQPEEMSRPYLFEILKVENAPETVKELGDKNSTITIIGNFSQCYD